MLHNLNIDRAIGAAHACEAHSGSWLSVDDRASAVAKAYHVATHHLGGLTRRETRDDSPAEYFGLVVGRVIGIEIPISRLIGNGEVSQNSASLDRLVL